MPGHGAKAHQESRRVQSNWVNESLHQNSFVFRSLSSSHSLSILIILVKMATVDDPATPLTPTGSEEGAAPAYEEAILNERIIVLVVGETQEGKSTLIKQISRYAQATGPNIRIGRGHRSCTTAVGEYNFSIPLQKYCLLDNTGAPIRERDFESLGRLRNEDATVSRKPETEGSTQNFTFIDTPGMNDSGGDDMDLMAGIVSKVSSLHHLNAIIYVRSVESAYNASFRNFFSYIQRSMPSISEGMIITHTRFTLAKALSHQRNNTSFSNQRRDAFKNATNLDACHFFMDNNPNPDRPFEVVESMNGIYRLLLFIRGQKAVSTKGLQLLKTRRMTNVDAHLIAALVTLRGKLESRWNSEVASAKQAKQELYRKIRDVANKRTLLKVYQEEIQTLLAEKTIHMGSRRVDKDFGFLDVLTERRLKQEPEVVVFQGDYPISSVEKTLGPGCKWQNEQQQGSFWTGTLSSSRLTDLEGSVTWYTTGALKYKDKLDHLHKECARLEGHLEVLNETFDQRGDELGDGDDTVSELQRHLKDCVTLLSVVEKQTFQMELYPRLKHIYLSDSLKPSQDDIFNFIQVYNQGLADVYWGESSA